MAAEDRAILVGISRYSDKAFAPLDGPANDLDRMRTWLLDPAGGNLLREHVVEVKSPEGDLSHLDPEDWNPTEHDFQRAFRRMVTDATTHQPIRRNSRLYLYFSGHGFSERRDQFTQAALYAANATRFLANNICGTAFALAAREQALFAEIVLIMDCCRDAELNLPLSKPPINTATADAASNVRFLALYAAPKGGKAQERAFPELQGKVCGLLTHALLRSLKQAQPDESNGVSSTAIKKYLLGTWAEVCGERPAPEPEFVLPTGRDIVFSAINAGVVQGFALNGSSGPLTLQIADAARRPVISCEIALTGATWRRNGQTPSSLSIVGNRFEIRLPPGLYRYTLSGARQSEGLFDATGAKDVEL